MSNSADEIMTQPTTKRVKLSKSENKDRMSDLPESLILLILSFLDSKHAVQTCVLSQRYKDLWKNIPALILHSSDFPTYKLFKRFLSLRDSSIVLQTLDFIKDNVGLSGRQILKKSVNYAISHKVQRLGVKHRFTGHISQIPATVFSCQTLTHLKLNFFNARGHAPFPKSLNLPALTNLKLEYFAFCPGNNRLAEPFSTLNNLDTLLLLHCSVRNAQTLGITSSTLVNLTISDLRSHEIDLCTPSFCKFVFIGTSYQRLSGSNVSSLKHVDIDTKLYFHCENLRILNWLSELANIKSLTVSTTILQVLYLILDPLKFKFKLPSLHDLKSLKVKKKERQEEAAGIQKAFEAGSIILDRILKVLLQNSPLAKVDFTECSRQLTCKCLQYILKKL